MELKIGNEAYLQQESNSTTADLKTHKEKHKEGEF